MTDQEKNLYIIKLEERLNFLHAFLSNTISQLEEISSNTSSESIQKIINNLEYHCEQIKQLLSYNGIQTVDYYHITADELMQHITDISSSCCPAAAHPQ